MEKHEESQAHINSKLAQVMFLQQRSITDILQKQGEVQEKQRQRNIEANRKVMIRVIDTVILLGKQDLAFRGHESSLASESSVNLGNFLEILKYLAKYDDVIAAHLEKVEDEHRRLESKKEGTEKGDKSRRFGRGSKLNFLT